MYFTHEPPVERTIKSVDPKTQSLVTPFKNIDYAEDPRKRTTIDRDVEENGSAFSSSEVRADDNCSDELHVFSVARGVRIVLLYLALGTFVFSIWFEDWTLIDAMYFTVVSFTTVGYGDLYPIDTSQRIFGVFYVLIGLIVLGGIFLDVIHDVLFEKYDNARKKATMLRSQPIKCTNTQSTEASSQLDNYKQVLCSSIPLLVFIILCSLFIGYYEGWSVMTSVYFCFITATSGKPLP